MAKIEGKVAPWNGVFCLEDMEVGTSFVETLQGIPKLTRVTMNGDEFLKPRWRSTLNEYVQIGAVQGKEVIFGAGSPQLVVLTPHTWDESTKVPFLEGLATPWPIVSCDHLAPHVLSDTDFSSDSCPRLAQGTQQVLDALGACLQVIEADCEIVRRSHVRGQPRVFLRR